MTGLCSPAVRRFIPTFLSTLVLGVAAATVLSASAFAQATAPKWSCPQPPATATAPQAPAEPVTTGSITPHGDPFKMRIVVVEWKIKKGRECDFLVYWSTRSTIPNRTGLISEFLSDVDKQPWVNWNLDENWTTFYNVGIWRETADFQDQIGKYIDNTRPPLDFEAARRQRVFLEPQAWRIGRTGLPEKDPAGVR